MAAAERQLDLEEYAADLAASARRAGERAALGAMASDDGEWVEGALVAVRELARSHARFTADDVRARVGPGPSRNGGLGAILAQAAREGVITCVGYATSRRPARHGGLLRVWRGR